MLCDTCTSGQAIADKIKFTLEKLKLDLNDLRGQGYDGAGNMSGKHRGAATIIQHTYPKALYIHCVSPVLNLCIVACGIQAIRNMYGVVEENCLFFNYSPKWQQELQEHIEILPVGTTSKTKLVNLCKTRWVARIEAFEVFRDMLQALVSTLEVISTARGWSTESSKKASALLISIIQFQFLMSLEGMG